MIEMNADMKVRLALYDFENRYNIRPNSINMGYRLADELAYSFYNDMSLHTLEELLKGGNSRVVCQYEGIPVRVVYDNPDTLEVGYMVKWAENKQ